MMAFVSLPRKRTAPDVNQVSGGYKSPSTLQLPFLTVKAGILIQTFFA
jgi:hypothetical protein